MYFWSLSLWPRRSKSQPRLSGQPAPRFRGNGQDEELCRKGVSAGRGGLCTHTAQPLLDRASPTGLRRSRKVPPTAARPSLGTGGPAPLGVPRTCALAGAAPKGACRSSVLSALGTPATPPRLPREGSAGAERVSGRSLSAAGRTWRDPRVGGSGGSRRRAGMAQGAGGWAHGLGSPEAGAVTGAGHSPLRPAARSHGGSSGDACRSTAEAAARPLAPPLLSPRPTRPQGPDLPWWWPPASTPPACLSGSATSRRATIGQPQRPGSPPSFPGPVLRATSWGTRG